MNIVWHMPVLRRRGCGLSIRAVELARRLLDRGHDVRFIVGRERTDVAEGEIAGVPVHKRTARGSERSKGRESGDSRGSAGSAWLRSHWSLQALARRSEAAAMAEGWAAEGDMLISCQPEVVTALSRNSDGRPVVYVCGGTTLLHDEADRRMWATLPPWRRLPYQLDRHWKHGNERQAFHAADLIVFDSESTRRRVVDAYRPPAERCHVVHGGVDERRFGPPDAAARARCRSRLGSTEGDFVVAWTGRLAVEKNLSLLLQALPLCRRPPERVLLVGDGPLRAELEAEAAALGVANRVCFLGERDDVRPFLHAADVFAFPSRGESFGGALAEAMACGLASVALRPDGAEVRNANEEIFQGCRLGLLVDGATPAAFAQGLDNLRDRPELRRRLGAVASMHALAFFTWGAAAGRLESLLLKLIRRAAASDISISSGRDGWPALTRA